MSIKPPRKIKMSKMQLNALKERIRERKLGDADWEAVEAMVDTVECLSQVIEEKNAAIGRLCKYLIGAPTETAKNVLKNKEGKRRLIGYCNIKNVNVLCCRSINSKIFITALPFENKF